MSISWVSKKKKKTSSFTFNLHFITLSIFVQVSLQNRVSVIIAFFQLLLRTFFFLFLLIVLKRFFLNCYLCSWLWLCKCPPPSCYYCSKLKNFQLFTAFVSKHIPQFGIPFNLSLFFVVLLIFRSNLLFYLSFTISSQMLCYVCLVSALCYP